MTQASETELIRLAREGDERALAELIGRYNQRVRTWAMWELGDLSVAEDACQEAWIRFHRTVHRLDPDQPVAGWLRTLVRNSCRDQRDRELRAARPRPAFVATEAPVDESMDLRRGARRMLAAFAELSPRQREALD